jgi:hypothetical protein
VLTPARNALPERRSIPIQECSGRNPGPVGSTRFFHQEFGNLLSILISLPLAISGPVEPLTAVNVLGIPVRTTPLKYDVSLANGIEARGRLQAFGGAGTIGLATGLKAPRHVDVKLNDVDAAEVAALIGDALPATFRDKLRGRIGLVELAIRGDSVSVKANQFRLVGDWLAKAEGTFDLKTRKYKLKMWAFGGLLEAEGKLPAQD